MSYLAKWFELENKTRKWEIKDSATAQIIAKDTIGKENWLKEYDNIEKDIINSNLSSSDKAHFLNRINKSRSYIENTSLNFHLPSFAFGIVCCYLFLNGLNKLGENFTKDMMRGFYKEQERENAI
jgi:hypothetical protein